MTIAPYGFQDNNPSIPASSATMEALVQYLGAYADTKVGVSGGTDGQVITYVSPSGPAFVDPPGLDATGPGDVVGANSGTALTLPAPGGSSGFGLYHLTLAPAAGSTVTVTMPAAVPGLRFVLRATQPSGGGNALAFAASPPVVFPGVGLSLNTGAYAENWVQFECALDNASNPTWYGFPATSSVQNLADVANANTARYNIAVPSLAPARLVATSNIASLSGTPTIDGVATASGDHVLLTAQTTASQNGPWIVAAGAWSRPLDYPAGATVPSGRTIEVYAGSAANTGSIWALTTVPVTVDTTATTWTRAGSTAPAFTATGLTGATQPTRYVGATVSGAPTTGTFLLGDFVIDQTGAVQVCTAAGTPGTWSKAGGGYSNIFGDGSDGAATLDGTTAVGFATRSGTTYTLNRDAYCASLTINAGVTLLSGGFRLFVNGVLTIAATGVIGGIGAAAVAAVAGASGFNGTLGGGPAGATGVTGNGAVGAKGVAGTGGTGGAGGTGAAGTAATGYTANANQFKSVFMVPQPALVGTFLYGSITSRTIIGGSSGASGGGDGTNAGGGGGAGGDLVVIFAKTVVNNGTIQSIGGNGGTPAAGNAGGGGGGAGGPILIYTLAAVTGSGTISSTGGTAGAGVGTGAAGGAGGAGLTLTQVVS